MRHEGAHLRIALRRERGESNPQGGDERQNQTRKTLRGALPCVHRHRRNLRRRIRKAPGARRWAETWCIRSAQQFGLMLHALTSSLGAWVVVLAPDSSSHLRAGHDSWIGPSMGYDGIDGTRSRRDEAWVGQQSG